MASYQEVLAERDRLKRRIVELEQRIRLLEGSTALVMARKLHAYRRPVLGILKLAMAANRVRRKLSGGEPPLYAPDTAILDVDFSVAGLDPKRETILLVSHDASQTGAPILCWNIARELKKTFNVVTVLIEGGVLAASFADVSSVVVGPLGPETRQVPRARKVAYNLAHTYKPLFVIANTAESRYLAAALAQVKVPVVALIHEFAAGLFPKGTMQSVFDWSSEIVFPASVVRDSFLPGYQSLRYKRARILCQGQSVVPPRVHDNTRDPSQPTRDELLAKLRPTGNEEALLVVGMGPADFRKGARPVPCHSAYRGAAGAPGKVPLGLGRQRARSRCS